MRGSAWQRRSVLALSSLFVLGSTYCYDNPGALKTQLQQHFGRTIPRAEFEVYFNLSYSLYSVPNVLLPFFGGVLIDTYGVSFMALVLASLILAGQVVTALGSSFENIYLLLAGRVLFGLGGETMWVAQTTFVTHWFSPMELGFAIGINNCVATLGTLLNDVLSPWIAAAFDVTFALWVGSFVCVFSLCATILLVRLESTLPFERASPAAPVRLWDLRRFSLGFWLIAVLYIVINACTGPFANVAGSVLLERNYFIEPPIDCRRCGLGAYLNHTCETLAPSCPMSPPFAWPLPQLAANCSIVSAFDQFKCKKGPPYLQDDQINCDATAWRHGPLTHIYCSKKIDATAKATAMMAITPLVSAVFSPLSGSLVDGLGARASLGLVADVAIAAGHVLVRYTTSDVALALTLSGIGQSLFAAAMWSAIPFVVPPRYVSTAFGAITSLSNVGLATVPLIVAHVYSRQQHYLPSVANVFVVLSACGVVLGLCLLVADATVLRRALSRREVAEASASTEQLLDASDRDL
ncbi:hypothetical protein SDRG_11151 [Saprolegnia diclina VS20]|uniref:Lysosomal dipeptide transporter MFSD1 n=1 Tax=Saprolegnia diclina (strain VS20) TaxID=1156394 RepID=T0RG20_SAPDV|nr:hypothetical protein SDRG_11151 [Saprolegnia diclina VS20]EQC31228.1 hypothetical protein SDRG_11151 [Saprolegnia diclina VS20]|eukprot:XP_008615401.1 hypothetical protein SDRG_11151 [Saprolegnia diclina VS20]